MDLLPVWFVLNMTASKLTRPHVPKLRRYYLHVNLKLDSKYFIQCLNDIAFYTVWTKCEFKHNNFGSLLKNTLKLILVWNLAWDIHVPVYGSGARVEVPVNIEQSHIF